MALSGGSSAHQSSSQPSSQPSSQQQPPLTLADLHARWSDLGRGLLQAGAPLVAAALGDGHATALVADLLTVECPPARLELLTDPAQQRLIANTCLAVFGTRLRLIVRAKVGKDGGQSAVTDERQRRYQAAQEHPAVRELMQRFEADLVGRELIDLQTWLGRIAAERDAAPQRRYAGDLTNNAAEAPWADEPSRGRTGGDASYD